MDQLTAAGVGERPVVFVCHRWAHSPALAYVLMHLEHLGNMLIRITEGPTWLCMLSCKPKAITVLYLLRLLVAGGRSSGTDAGSVC